MWHEALCAVGLDDRALALRCADEYVRARAGVLALSPGALDVLVELRERGCKLGLVTNGFAATHHDKIDRLGPRGGGGAGFTARRGGGVIKAGPRAVPPPRPRAGQRARPYRYGGRPLRARCPRCAR